MKVWVKGFDAIRKIVCFSCRLISVLPCLSLLGIGGLPERQMGLRRMAVKILGFSINEPDTVPSLRLHMQIAQACAEPKPLF